MNDCFSSVVVNAFVFLEDKHGFCIRERGRSTVIYESPMIVASLFYDDQRSFEVSLGLRRKSDPQPLFAFDEILRSLDVPSTIWAFGSTARTLADAQRLIEKMAAIMASYATPLLEGDNRAWERIAEQRRKESQNYALERDLRMARAEADVAWRKKDYASVVRALKPLRAALTATEIGKLEFAEKQIRNPGSRS